MRKFKLIIVLNIFCIFYLWQFIVIIFYFPHTYSSTAFGKSYVSHLTTICSIFIIPKMRRPGIEPGSITWQATIITTRPTTLILIFQKALYIYFKLIFLHKFDIIELCIFDGCLYIITMNCILHTHI